MDSVLNKKILEILNSISDGFIFLNTKMEIEFINDAAEVLFEQPKKDIINRSVWEALPKYKDTFIYDLYEKAYSEQIAQHFEIPSPYRDRIYEAKVFPDLNGLFIIFSDITLRKKEEKRRLQYNQLNTIREMAAGVAHEVRNPLTTFKGFLQLMKQNEEYRLNKEILQLMIEEIGRVNDIITNFLDLSKDKSNRLEILNLNTIIETSYPLIETRAVKEGKSMKLKLGCISDVTVDKNEIRQLLFNLVNNSLDSMEQGKTVEILTYEESEHVVLAIKDEGSGIPAEIMEYISIPFVTSKKNGTGLGLSICFSIVERNNAEIHYTSSSAGTTFNILFPIAKSL